jgi:hypothetical protein
VSYWKLSPVSIKTPDEDGATVMVEPGLNLITYMGWAVDSGVFIMRNPEFSSMGISNQVGRTFHRLDLADHQCGRQLPSR